VENLTAGDEVLKGEDEVTIDGVEEDQHGTLVGFTNEDGEEYILYEDILGDEFQLPGAADSDSEGEGDTADGETDAPISEGDTAELMGEEVTITGVDTETNVVAYETPDGETDLTTLESVTDEPEPTEDEQSQRVREEVGLGREPWRYG